MGHLQIQWCYKNYIYNLYVYHDWYLDGKWSYSNTLVSYINLSDIRSEIIAIWSISIVWYMVFLFTWSIFLGQNRGPYIRYAVYIIDQMRGSEKQSKSLRFISCMQLFIHNFTSTIDIIIFCGQVHLGENDKIRKREILRGIHKCSMNWSPLSVANRKKVSHSVNV